MKWALFSDVLFRFFFSLSTVVSPVLEGEKQTRIDLKTWSSLFELHYREFCSVEESEQTRHSLKSKWKEHPELYFSMKRSSIDLFENHSSEFKPLFEATFNEKCELLRVVLYQKDLNGNIESIQFLRPDGNIEKVEYINREVLALEDIYKKPIQIFGEEKTPEQLLNISRDSSRVILTVLDTGVDYNHPALAYKIPRDNRGLTKGYDFLDHDDMPYDYSNGFLRSGENDYFHGTHVAGIAAAGEQIEILPIRYSLSEPSSFFSAVSLAKERGSKIINCSFGIDFELHQAIQENPDILFVVAAGNFSLELDPKNEDSRDNALIEELPNMLVVGSVNKAGNLSGFSNYSSNFVHLAALGEDVFSTFPEGKYGKLSGTSMAAPRVSNIAAKMLAVNPELSPVQIVEIFKKSVDQKEELVSKLKFAGIANEEKALELAGQIQKPYIEGPSVKSTEKNPR